LPPYAQYLEKHCGCFASAILSNGVGKAICDRLQGRADKCLAGSRADPELHARWPLTALELLPSQNLRDPLVRCGSVDISQAGIPEGYDGIARKEQYVLVGEWIEGLREPSYETVAHFQTE
jgi:hypothetical protein